MTDEGMSVAGEGISMNVGFYAVGIAVLLALFLVCAGLCYKQMNNNRGNFINLPAWRKAVRIVMNLVLYVLLGFFLWKGGAGTLWMAFGLVIVVLTLLAAAFAVWHRRTNLRRRAEKQQEKRQGGEEEEQILGEPVLSSEGIPAYEYVWNQMVVEYIAYAVCWLSKSLIIAITAILAAWQVAGYIWQIGPGILSVVDTYIMSPLSSCLYICFMTAVIFSVAFLLLVMMVERSKEDAEVDQKKREIRRRFQSNEHGV